MKTLRVHYEGRVQGVGFRYTVKNLAREYDVSGTVENLPDGRVELIASGDADEVDAFLEGIRTSHLAGHIALESPQAIPRPATLRGFSIVP
jgi:acylphosphatase